MKGRLSVFRRSVANTPVRLVSTTRVCWEREREKPPKTFSEILDSRRLFSPKQYEKLGQNAEKLLKRDMERQKLIKASREEERQRRRQQQDQIIKDKEASVLTKGALKRKMSAITKWAQREHPEIWERIVAKISLKESLRGHPWEPAVILSYEEMEEMKELRREEPRKWSYFRLAHKYGISVLAVSKIIGSSFSPTPKQRVTRWLEREEFKRMQERFLRSIAREERSKLIEADLKTRYGVLYSPPPDRTNPFVRKIRDDVAQLEDSDSEGDDSDEEEDKDDGSHSYELRTGSMTSVYRRITAEARAVVASKLETDILYQRAFQRDINRITREQKINKEKEEMMNENPKKPQRSFFNIQLEDDTKVVSKPYHPKSFASLSNQPWRQKHIKSRKSTRIKQWPDPLPNTRKTNLEENKPI